MSPVADWPHPRQVGLGGWYSTHAGAGTRGEEADQAVASAQSEPVPHQVTGDRRGRHPNNSLLVELLTGPVETVVIVSQVTPSLTSVIEQKTKQFVVLNAFLLISSR